MGREERRERVGGVRAACEWGESGVRVRKKWRASEGKRGESGVRVEGKREGCARRVGERGRSGRKRERERGFYIKK